MVEWLLDTNKAIGCSPNPRITCNFGGKTDPDCGGTRDPDMNLGSSLVWMSALPQAAVQATQISMAPGHVSPLDTNLAVDLGHPCGLRW